MSQHCPLCSKPHLVSDIPSSFSRNCFRMGSDNLITGELSAEAHLPFCSTESTPQGTSALAERGFAGEYVYNPNAIDHWRVK
jgi:hypothetical protein